MCFIKICQKINIPDYRRFRWFFWILFLSLLSIFIFYLDKDNFFYLNAINGIGNIYRFFWILPFSFMGFSFLALLVSKGGLSKDKPWLSYLFSYFPRLVAFSLIIFSILHLFKETSGYIYYFFSAGLGLYLGYNIDWIKLEDFLKKGK